jgi:hypothetical protein
MSPVHPQQLGAPEPTAVRPRGLLLYAISTLVYQSLVVALLVGSFMYAAVAHGLNGVAGAAVSAIAFPIIGLLTGVPALFGAIQLARRDTVAKVALGFHIASLLAFAAALIALLDEWVMVFFIDIGGAILAVMALLLFTAATLRLARAEGARLAVGRSTAAVIVTLPFAMIGALLLVLAGAAWSRKV